MATTKAPPPKSMQAQPPAQDKLDRAKDAVRRIRDLRLEKEVAEEKLKSVNIAILDLEHRELPDLFDEARITHLGLEAEGNLPAYVAKVSPYYHANIAADWPEEKRAESFLWLVKNGHGGLIKTAITIELGRGEMKRVKAVQAALKKLKVDYSVSLNVAWNTLTAFVREQVEEKQESLPLDILGAKVGRVVRLSKPK